MLSGLEGLSRLAALAVVVAGVGQAGMAVAQTPEEFYSGNLVTVLTGHPPGGSYDLYSQLAAAHLGRHIPGNPTVVVQHMPGGAGFTASAYFANRAPRDGTVIAILPETLSQVQVLDPQFARWDMREMRYIGSFADVTAVMGARKDGPVQSWEDMKTTPANVSCGGRTTTSNQGAAILKYFTGVPLNIVCGYDSASASILALFRGEADLSTTIWATWASIYSQQLEAGEVKPIIQFGLTRLPDLPDVPTAIELVDDPDQKAAFTFFAVPSDIGRAILTPPGIPEDRYEALVAAFESLVVDPEFLADAQTRGMPINPKSAEEVAQINQEIFNASPEVIELLSVAREEGFN